MKQPPKKKPVSAAGEEARLLKLREVITLAQQRGLFQGGRTKVVRGRMPQALVEQAKAKTGIKSDTNLIQAALANLAVADDYPEWLLSQRGTLDADLDLEF